MIRTHHIRKLGRPSALQRLARGTCAIAILALCESTASAQTADTPARASTPTSPALSDEIIVTASKRSERLRDVPASITALSGSTLEHLGVTSFRDYASLVPGLSQRDSGAPGLGTIIIRGLNTGSSQTTNTTAFYIDDTPFSASGYLSQGGYLTPEPELADIDHIEVLKGPQGTLYGASSLGGLVRVVTKKPDLENFSGSARAELSSTDGGNMGYLLRATVNVPIVTDTIAATFTAYHRRLGGFIDNVTTGDKNINSSNLSGGRVAVLAKLSDRLKIEASGLIQNIDSNGYAFERLAPNSLDPLFGPYQFNSFKNIGSTIRYRIADLTATYDTDIGALTATGSYGQYSALFGDDGTTAYLAGARSFLTTRAMPLFGVPLNTLLPADSHLQTAFSPHMKKYTSEGRFTSKRLGPVEFIAGVFYTNEKSYYPSSLTVYPGSGSIPATRNPLLYSNTLSNYQEYAGFGNLTFYLTDRLDVTGGVRYAHNNQQDETGGPGAVTYYVPRATADFKASDNSTTYLATLRWRPTNHFSAYLRAASGYRPGGPQTNPTPPAGAQTTILPDTVWNYEGGIKGSFLDGTLTIDASVYHIDWKNIQLNSTINGIVLPGNGGKAKVDGAESEIQVHPSRDLTIGANFGYTHARLTSISPGTATALGAHDGDDLPFTPKVTAAITVDQNIPLNDTVKAYVGGTLRFQSDMPNAFGVQTGSQHLPEITTVDLRAGIDFGRYSIDARVANLTNRLAILTVAPGNEATVMRPRTVTIGAGVKF